MPNQTNSIQATHLPPKALIYFLLIGGLAALAYAIVNLNMIMACMVVCLPFALLLLGYGLVTPRFVYLLYATYAFFFTGAMRYIRMDKLSVGLDILLVYLALSLVIVTYYKNNKEFKWSSAVNVYTVSYIAWVFFSIFQLTNPGIDSDGIETAFRKWIVGSLALYALASVVSNTWRTLQNGLMLVGIFIFIAFIKVLWQRYIGFDSAEKIWLYVDGKATTHILYSGIRYFSYFTDAANFGTIMGIVTVVYPIIGLTTTNRLRKIFYISIGIMGVIGMFMSGTRGALVVPGAGYILYCLLCKNIRIFSFTASFGILIFIFLAFTDIGNGNQFIRRARTAIQPTEDASFNVRIRNRQEIAEYLKNHPWGVGISEDIPKLWVDGETYTEGTLPPDSFFVYIWIQTGLFGLILYIGIYAVVLLHCCYTILFKIQDKKLRHALAAFICAVFGTLVCGYVANSPGMPPTNFLIVAMIAFVMNGTYIDQQLNNKLKSDKISTY